MASTYIVIGASTGLGRATAHELRKHHRVVTIGRRPEDEINADLRNLDDVARAAIAARALGPIAGIACNAGLQDAGTPTYTSRGIEQTFAVNVLAHLAFLAHLAPPKETHIGFVGSGTLDPDNGGARRMGFHGGRYTNAATLAAGKNDETVSAAQNGKDRYATSKLCDLLVVRALAARGVHAFAIDPGLMPGTGLARDYGPFSRFLWSTRTRGACVNALPTRLHLLL